MRKVLLLVSGLGLGAGLMYMLDPDRGRRRRVLARRQVASYRHWTDHLLDQTRRTLGQQSHTLGRQARGLLEQVRRRTPLRPERWPGATWLGRTEPKANTPNLLMLGCMGLGVGLMYMFDPMTGRRRRALLSDTVRSYWYRTGGLISKTAREARSRTYGLVSAARAQLSSTDVPDNAVLQARVRAQIGHMVSHPGGIDVRAEQGHVTLRGPVSASAAEKLLTTVASIPGVTEVVNQLEVHDETEYISGLQDNNIVG